VSGIFCAPSVALGSAWHGQDDLRYAVALHYARKIAALDAKPASERRREDVWNRLSYCEHLAHNLRMERVSVPRVRLGSIKPKQSGDEAQTGGAGLHGSSSGRTHPSESAEGGKRESAAVFPLKSFGGARAPDFAATPADSLPLAPDDARPLAGQPVCVSARDARV
jgi:hypothetical protein